MKIKVTVELPKKLSVSQKTKEELDNKLIIKKLKKYGFFNVEGKWKEK